MNVCHHNRAVTLIWRCLRTLQDTRDWAAQCVDCEAYDITPGPDATIYHWSYKLGRWMTDVQLP